MNAQGVCKRRGFPWKIAAVVVLGIVAVKSMREQRWDWASVEHLADHAHFRDAHSEIRDRTCGHFVNRRGKMTTMPIVHRTTMA